MEKIIRSRRIHGIDLRFLDLKTSGTVDYVFGELEGDYYGLEKISLSPKDTVIDIGSNVGMFSIYVKKKFGCRVIAFEPVPLNFENFKENIILNGLELSDFELHNTAITDVDGDTLQIGTPEYNSGGSSVYHAGGIQSICKTTTLHSYIDDSCKYLKIDTEGGEYSIIPSILDYLNVFDYLGIEFHKFLSEHSPDDLYALILENFNGKIFSNIPGQ